VSVDGGGNQWDAVRQNYPNIQFPHIVSGDFDSIKDPVMDLFKKQTGIYIEKTPDQDETDFTKAIRKLKEKMALQQVAQVYKILRLFYFIRFGNKLIK
jgi:thiamine pyrophosphokinase